MMPLAEAIATVARGGSNRICAPGLWIVRKVEGQTKPRVRFLGGWNARTS